MNNNILITSAGRRVSLVRIFKKELKHFFPDAKLFTADADPLLSAACYESDGAFKVMKNDADGYINQLLDLAVEQGVKVIIPTIDTGLQILSDHKNRFEEKGIHLLICTSQLIDICRDKRKTSLFFSENGIDSPIIYDKDNLQYPLFIKPYDGSMSVDTYLINTQDQITQIQLANEKFMFMEYINNNTFNEFTIDMYYDRNHYLKCLVPRKRIEVRGGEINKGITVKGYVFEFLKERLKYVEGACGCVTMQLFYNAQSNEIKALEINPRFGGGYPLSYLAGANYPRNIISEYLLNQDVPSFDDWEDNLLMLRYDDEILVHDSNL
ncbi:ATP-grasp domain-containing protein [Flavihumibacter sp. R14]|nr:ATP-grasp domain-containing protein [Flavihumibacter soli]